jgi:phenylacetate-CoA ligase
MRAFAYDWKMEIYWRMPVLAQETVLSLYSRYLDRLYYGPTFDQWLEYFAGWKNWSLPAIQDWQNQQLQSLIALAANRVPFYQQQWRNVDWRSIRKSSDLCVLPCLDRQALRNNELAFVVEGLKPSQLWVEKTSGTTGTSLRIYWPMSMLPKWWALTEVMVRNAANVGQNIPRAMMGGRPIVPGNTSKPPYWRFNRHWNQLYLSSYHVSRSTAYGYVEAILRYGSQWIIGYGSAIAALAESCLAGGISPVRLRTVITSGDTLLAGMRKSIETFFQCKCIDQYGQSEGVCIAQECSHSQMHVIPAAGIIEIVREDGSPCAPGEVGEVVATGLLNDAMPLIRYRMGDYAAWGVNQSCSCGNPHPIITNLEGRLDDYLLTSDGRKIGRLSTAVKRSPTIHSSQIVQDQLGHAYLLVRPGVGYQSSHAVAVKDDILERIGKFKIEIIEVGEIPKTPRGKAALVVRLEERPQMIPIYNVILSSRKSPHEPRFRNED